MARLLGTSLMRDGGLRQLFRKHLPDVFWISVESGGTGRGIPDSFAIWNSSCCWIEFKNVKIGWKTSLTPEQIGWHLRYARYGGRSYIAIRHNDLLWMVKGALAEECVSLRGWAGTEERRCYVGGPSAWDWNSIKKFIFY